MVLHTALPRFNPQFRAACGAALGESLNSCLQLFAAHEPPLASLALPVLHSDEQQFPEEWACGLTLKHLRAWLETRPEPLPPGWTVKRHGVTGEVYYVNEQTGARALVFLGAARSRVCATTARRGDCNLASRLLFVWRPSACASLASR